MEVTLIIVTMLSLALAIGMSIVAWRLLQEERQRAAARVALLEEGLAASLAANPPSAAAMPMPTPAAPATPSATRLLDLHAADEPDWLAQFPSSKATMNGWTRSTAPLAPLNGTVAALEKSDASHEDESGVRWSHTRNGATPEEHAAVDAAPEGASAVANAYATDDTSPMHELPPQARHPLEASDALGAAEGLGVAEAASLMPTSAASAHRLFVDADADADPAAAAEHGRAYAGVAAGASAARRPLLALGIGAAVMVVAMLALWAVGRLMLPASANPNAHQQSAPASASASGPASAAATTSAATTTTATSPTAASATATASGAPLELVALKQVRDGDALTISGVVRNPHEGAPVERIAAVISFFDGAGAQLTSVRAPLDFRTLAPGDESPFQVTTTVPAGVSRYRVSFRRDEGTIVPHVDRRTQETS
jgi:hypothetical protein